MAHLKGILPLVESFSSDVVRPGMLSYVLRNVS